MTLIKIYIILKLKTIIITRLNYGIHIKKIMNSV